MLIVGAGRARDELDIQCPRWSAEHVGAPQHRVLAITWYDVLRDVTTLAADDVSFRHALPLQPLDTLLREGAQVAATDIEQRESDEPARLTCRALDQHTLPSWHLLSLEPA